MLHGQDTEEKQIQKIVLISYKDGIKNASLAHKQKHLLLNVLPQSTVFYLKEVCLGCISFNYHFSKICSHVKAN